MLWVRNTSFHDHNKILLRQSDILDKTFQNLFNRLFKGLKWSIFKISIYVVDVGVGELIFFVGVEDEAIFVHEGVDWRFPKW